jgi:predicted small lipoprotein YifL
MAAISGDYRLPHFRDRPFTRLALIGVAVASLTLAGCGRKGPLDPPPGASMASQPVAEVPPTTDPLLTPVGQPRENALPQAKPSDPNRKFFLDGILN